MTENNLLASPTGIKLLTKNRQLLDDVGALRKEVHEKNQKIDSLTAQLKEANAILAAKQASSCSLEEAEDDKNPSPEKDKASRAFVKLEQALLALQAKDEEINDLKLARERREADCEILLEQLGKFQTDILVTGQPNGEAGLSSKLETELLNERARRIELEELLAQKEKSIAELGQALTSPVGKDSSDHSTLMDLIHLKSLGQLRKAADEEFALRFKKLEVMLENARIGAVQKNYENQGRVASQEEIKEISTRRLKETIEETNNLMNYAQFTELPYAKVVLEHFLRHITVSRALNKAVYELKCLQNPHKQKK